MNGPRDPSARRSRSRPARWSGATLVILALTCMLTNAMRRGSGLNGRGDTYRNGFFTKRTPVDDDAPMVETAEQECMREAREEAAKRIQVNDIVKVMYDDEAPKGDGGVETFAERVEAASRVEAAPEAASEAESWSWRRPFTYQPPARVERQPSAEDLMPVDTKQYWVGIVRKAQPNSGAAGTALEIHHLDGWLRSATKGSTNGMFVVPGCDAEAPGGDYIDGRLRNELYQIFSGSATYGIDVTRGGWADDVKAGGYFFEEDPRYAADAAEGAFDHYVKVLSVDDKTNKDIGSDCQVHKIMVQKAEWETAENPTGEQRMHSHAMDTIDTSNVALRKYWAVSNHERQTVHASRMRIESAGNGDFPFAIHNQKILDSLLGRRLSNGEIHDDGEPTLQKELEEYDNYATRLTAAGGSASEFNRESYRIKHPAGARKIRMPHAFELRRASTGIAAKMAENKRKDLAHSKSLQLEGAAPVKETPKEKYAKVQAAIAERKRLANDGPYQAAVKAANEQAVAYKAASADFDGILAQKMQTLVLGSNPKWGITSEDAYAKAGEARAELLEQVKCPMQCNLLDLQALNLVIGSANAKNDTGRDMLLKMASKLDSEIQPGTKDGRAPVVPAHYRAAAAAMQREIAHPHSRDGDLKQALAAEKSYVHELLGGKQTPLLIDAKFESRTGNTTKAYMEGSARIRDHVDPSRGLFSSIPQPSIRIIRR